MLYFLNQSILLILIIIIISYINYTVQGKNTIPPPPPHVLKEINNIKIICFSSEVSKVLKIVLVKYKVKFDIIMFVVCALNA